MPPVNRLPIDLPVSREVDKSGSNTLFSEEVS
jgi:hypothetical protein